MTRDGNHNFDAYDDDYSTADYDQEFEEECGLMPDGQCALAGTEHCDWDCGRLNAQRIDAMKSAQTDT